MIANTSLGRDRRRVFSWAFALAGLLGPAAGVEAQPAYKVKELNPTFNAANSYPGSFVDLNGVVLFTAISPEGRELWRSDGSEAGTLLLKDVFPGATSSETNYLTKVGEVVYFQAKDPAAGYELWKTDGTPSGTVMVKDINPGPSWGDPYSFLDLNGIVFFQANDGAHGNELWKSDGTADGTVLVKDLRPGSASFSPSLLTGIGGHAYFVSNQVDLMGRELWRTDGTEAGTILLKDFRPGAGWGQGRVQLDGIFYFSADDGIAGRELWRSDGTPSGTFRVADIRPGASGSEPFYLTAFAGSLYFAANDGVAGIELWKSDGTAAGTARVLDLRTGVTSADPNGLTVFGDHLYFAANDGARGYELWRTDGSAAGTALVSDTWSGSGPGGAFDLTPMGDALFFCAASSYNNNELWKTDGTQAGTVLVREIRAGAADSNPRSLVVAGGRLFLSADDGPHGQEPWVSDGTTAGTVLLKDVYPSPNSGSPSSLVALGSTLFFAANNGGTYGLNGIELWTSDGTEAGTAMVKDLAPAPVDSSMPSLLTPFKGKVYFNAKHPTSGLELWRSDGTEAGTVVWNDSWGGGSGNPEKLTTAGDLLYYTATNGLSGIELWKTDGFTNALVKDIRPWNGSNPHDLTDLDGTLLFAANDGSISDELWRSDGTAPGTTLVKDIQPGPSGSGPTGLTRVGGTVFFAASEAASGRELWRTGGTAAGTVPVKDIRPAGSSSPANLTRVGAALFFSADDGGTGIELWKSDGTADGTVLVADINPGPGASNPANLRDVDGTLFFTASDGTHGLELWRSDGTTAGTSLVEDLALGSASSSPQFLTDVNGTLLFRANDGVNGAEMWSSDGTPTGTFLVEDINPGPSSAGPASITLAGDRVFFAANDGVTGVELWALANQAPVAQAGADQTVELGALLTLDGSGSSDPDGSPLLYEWRDGSGALLGRGPVLSPSLALGVHPFTLTVRDGLGGRSVDEVLVTVQDATAPVVTVASPGEGETLLTGQPYVIRWTAFDAGDLEAVVVSYSTDGGATFAPVPGCESLPGLTVSCAWAPAGPAAAAARVRVEVRDATANLGSAEVSIALADPFLSLTVPGVPVTWAPGSAQEVPWAHNLPAGAEVTVDLSRDGGATFETLALAVPASAGAFPWVVTGPRTTTARVRVRWSADLSVGDVSDADVTINGAPTANAGGPQDAARNQAIAFDGGASTDPDGDSLTYDWDFGDGTTDTGPSPSHAYTSLGRYTVTLVVSDGLATSPPASAIVTIGNLAPAASAGPDQVVELGSPVTLDGGGSSDPDGDPLTYEWRDATGATVGDSVTTTLALGLGVHDLSLTVRDDQGGVVSDAVQVTVRDTTAPAVAVVALPGGPWLTGVPIEIQWTAMDADALAGFDVLFSTDGGAAYLPVPGCTGLSGSARACSWLSPGPRSSDARVQVVARDPSGNSAAAVAVFTLVDPTLVVTTPNAGENWGVGTVQSVTWTHNLGSSSTVRIELSRDGGSTWSLLAPSAPNTGRFDWTVVGATTGAARVRVIWAGNPAVLDGSDASFTIAAPYVRVTSPNTKVTWAVGSARTLAWSHNLGAGSVVRLEISRNGGSSWSVLAASVTNGAPATGTWPWTVSGPATTRARIRVIWTASAGVNDRSDTNFTIQ